MGLPRSCSSLVIRTRHVHGNCCISAGKDKVPTVSAVQLQQWQWMRCSCSCSCCTMGPNASPNDAGSRDVLRCHNCPSYTTTITFAPSDEDVLLSGSPCWWVNRCLNVEWLDDCAAKLLPKDDKLREQLFETSPELRTGLSFSLIPPLPATPVSFLDYLNAGQCNEPDYFNVLCLMSSLKE